MKQFILSLSVLFLLASCSSSKQVTVRFTPKQNEIFTKKALRNLLTSSNSPAVIIRVPDRINTDITRNNAISLPSTYNTIEREFVKNEFTVRDRSIFNTITRNNHLVDYKAIYDATKVDIFVELVDITLVDFSTNIYYDKKGNQKVMNYYLKQKGYKVEFKVVNLKENEVTGNYSFYYTPCIDGCTYTYYPKYGIFPPNYNYKKNEGKETIPYESISVDLWTAFVADATTKMIYDMKKK